MVNQKTFTEIVVLYHPDADEEVKMLISRLQYYGVGFTQVNGTDADDLSRIGEESLVFFLASEGLVGLESIVQKLWDIRTKDIENSTFSLVPVECGAFKNMGRFFRLLSPLTAQQISQEDTEYMLSPLRRVLEENGFQIKVTTEGAEGKSAYLTK